MQEFFQGLGFSQNLAGDLSLLAILVAASILLGSVIGRFRLVHLILHIYISYAILLALPEDMLAFSAYAEVIVFFGVLILLTTLGDRLFDIHARASVYGWISTLILGFLSAGLLLGMLFRLLPGESFLWDVFSSHSVGYFTGEWVFTGWLIAPLVFLVFVNTRR